jgi:hypothetical protein
MLSSGAAIADEDPEKTGLAICENKSSWAKTFASRDEMAMYWALCAARIHG